MSTLKADSQQQKLGLVPTATASATAFYKAPLEVVGVCFQTFSGFLGMILVLGSVVSICLYIVPLKHHPRCRKSIAFKRNITLISLVSFIIGLLLISVTYQNHALNIDLKAAYEMKQTIPSAAVYCSAKFCSFLDWLKSWFA